MINYIWELMIIAGVVAGFITGCEAGLVSGLLDASSEAVELIISMLGIMGLWSGLMKVAEKAGIIDRLTMLMTRPIIYLYPGVKPGSVAAKHLTTNLVANFLGLGYAATPSGILAMKELVRQREEYCDIKTKEIIMSDLPDKAKRLKKYEKGTPGNDMCTFLIIHICSMQLIPVNLIAYRNKYGSISPGAVVGYGMVVTVICVLVAILYSKVCAAIFKD